MILTRGTKLLAASAPALFALHELEEYATALPWLVENRAQLPDWLAPRIPESPVVFAVAGIVFFVLYAISAASVIRKPESRTLVCIFAVLIVARLENALVHVGHALAFGGYTPGVLTAAVVVLPISLVIVVRMLSDGMITRRSLAWILPVAAIAQAAAIVALTAPAFNRRSN